MHFCIWLIEWKLEKQIKKKQKIDWFIYRYKTDTRIECNSIVVSFNLFFLLYIYHALHIIVVVTFLHLILMFFFIFFFRFSTLIHIFIGNCGLSSHTPVNMCAFTTIFMLFKNQRPYLQWRRNDTSKLDLNLLQIYWTNKNPYSIDT